MTAPSGLRRRRREPKIAMPEGFTFADTGCEVAPACLECPLPQCKYDDPSWYKAYKGQGRDAEIRAAFEGGLSAIQVGRRFGIAERTVHRALLRARSAA